MRILINASNLGAGGGAAQVADSVCRELYKYDMHSFVVVLPKTYAATAQAICNYNNVKVKEFSYPSKDWKSLLTKRNDYLDDLVDEEQPDCVLTIFGPTKWVPKCKKHICGFAFAHIPLFDSPYFNKMKTGDWVKAWFRVKLMSYLFRRCSHVFYTENPMISEMIKKKFHVSEVYTITNNYNQVFDDESLWIKHPLPSFDGTRIFSATSMMPHKNLSITLDAAKYLNLHYPSFKFQFVLTVQEKDFYAIPDELKEHFLFTGGVRISEIPSLYSQCDLVIQPSLLECFTAAYPEAMKMEKPLIVPDLEFVKGLCANAAVYYSPLSGEDAAECIYKTAIDAELQKTLIENGKKQILSFDTYEQRAEKIIRLCEQL